MNQESRHIASEDRTRGVSVAIATYNGARFLPELLQSIERQTVKPLEVVISDDASSDDTISVAESFAAMSPIPVKIIRHGENVGIIDNFLSAFRATTAPLIAYADQDDVWDAHRLETSMGYLQTTSTAMFRHASLITDEDLIDTGRRSHQENGDGVLRYPSVSTNIDGWGHQMIFDRATLDVLLSLYECQTFRETPFGTCFDHGIPFAASLVGDIRYSSEALVKFRRHSGAHTDAAASAPRSGIAEKVENRLSRLDRRRDMLSGAISIFDACTIAGARSIERSRRAYEDALALVTKRLNLAGLEGVMQRAAAAAGLAPMLLRQHRRYGDVRLRDIAGDALTVCFGAGRARA